MRRLTRGRSGLALACAATFAVLLSMLAARPASAIESTQMPTPQLEARYVALTRAFRCPVCQSESLRNSDSQVAAEIRAKIRRLLLAGKSNRQIREFLISRYTQFILMKPEYSWRNALLWLSPFIFLIIGGFIAARIIRARSALVAEDLEPVDDDLILDTRGSSAADSIAHR